MAERNADGVLRSSLDRRGFLRLTGFGALALGLGGPLLSACGSGDSASAASRKQTFENVTVDQVKKLLEIDPAHALQGQKFQLGALLPLSGAGTYYGDVQSKGANLAAKLIKELGGPDVEVVAKDHKSGDPQAGVSAFRELQAANVEFIYSTYIADFYALLPAFEKSPVFVLEGGQQGITDQVEAIPHYWSGDVSVDGYYPLLFKYIKETKPEIKTVASISVDVGEAVRKAARISLTEAAAQQGIKVVMEEYVPYGTTEFSTLISQAQSKNPDALINGMSPGGGLLARQAKQAGLNVPQYGGNLAVDDVKVGGSALDGFTFASYWLNVDSPGSPYAQYFVDRWDKEYGTQPLKPDAYGAIAFDIGMQMWQLWMEADKRGMPINQDTLNQIAGETTVKSVFGGTADKAGTLSWDPKSHFPNGEIGIFELNKGALTQKASSEWDGTTGFKLT
jgi:ABC-type branched-subunit amino acid transport system substrate-binding protein